MKKFFLTFSLLLLALAASAELKYVFLFVGDGMGMGHVLSAETYNRTVLKNKEHILMMQFPVASMALTYSASSPVTDSAAAGTALATGAKANNGMIGMNADSVNVTSVATQLKQRGWGVGVITSVAFDDATPATQFAHQLNRKMYEGINNDGAVSNFDFIGGAYTLMAKYGVDKCKPIFNNYSKHGYDVVYSLDKLKQTSKSKKILAAVGTAEKYNDFPYTIDSIEGAPKLRELTEACLIHMLRVSPDHFYMLVEGGNIDHAAHSNDGATVVKEVLNFQESIRVAYEFYLQHPDETLIVVTADHDTGGMTLGVDKGRKVPTLEDIDWRSMSKENFNDYCMRNKLSWEQVKQLMETKLGLWSHIAVTEDEEEAIKESFEKINSGASEKTLYKDFNQFSSVVFNILNHKNGIGFTTFSHTGNPVPVFAIGAGSDKFKSVNNNIEIPQTFRELLNIK